MTAAKVDNAQVQLRITGTVPAGKFLTGINADGTVATGIPAFTHFAVAGNISANYTTIDNALCNGNPNAILLITANWNPPGGSGIYNTNALGVFYNNPKWAIFNQNSLVAFPVNSAYNVFVLKP